MRLSAVLMATLVAASLAAAPPAGAVAGFGDVDSDRFYTDAVQWMVDNDITTGTSPTCFSPDEPVTRGQAAAFLWRMEAFPAGAAPHPFDDVVAPWQQDPVSWMYAEGITTGTSPTTYSPDETLTRGQMAALLWRAAGEPPATPTTFPDVFKSWQILPVGWMEAEDITTGTSLTTFSPEDSVTRGQFATFAWRWKDEPPVVVDEYTPLCGGRDDFNNIGIGWNWFFDDPAGFSFTALPGHLSLTGSPDSGGHWYLRTPVAADFEIETRVLFSPSGDFQAAGLSVEEGPLDKVNLIRAFCDPSNGPACVGDGIYLDNIDPALPLGNGPEIALPPGTGEVYLRLRNVGDTFTGWYSTDGASWTLVGSVNRNLSETLYGVWTGNSTMEPIPTARFDSFTEQPL
jgi:hypothetical protein